MLAWLTAPTHVTSQYYCSLECGIVANKGLLARQHVVIPIHSYISFVLIILCMTFLALPMAISKVVSDKHLAQIAECIIRWENLAPHLGIDEPEEVEIKIDNRDSYGQQKKSCLRKWRQKYGDRATYHSLIEAAKKVSGESHLASHIAGLLGKYIYVASYYSGKDPLRKDPHPIVVVHFNLQEEDRTKWPVPKCRPLFGGSTVAAFNEFIVSCSGIEEDSSCKLRSLYLATVGYFIK